MPENQKAALVTGGAVRVGKAIALTLAQHGYDIALHYHRSEENAQAVQAEIESLGRRCILLPADLSDDTQLNPLIDKTFETFPACDLLINNASIFEKCSFEESSLDDFDRHMAINAKAPFFLTQYFARNCKKGHVITILDSYITTNTLTYFPYLLTKKYLHDFTLMAAKALGERVRVNGICPGSMMPSDYWDQAAIDKKSQSLPLGTQPRAEQLTDAMLYLIRSDYLTGQCIFVDGGQHVT